VTWREESAAVTATYENWARAPRGEHATAYAAYVTALDSEERAASAYRHLVEQASAQLFEFIRLAPPAAVWARFGMRAVPGARQWGAVGWGRFLERGKHRYVICVYGAMGQATSSPASCSWRYVRRNQARTSRHIPRSEPPT
jgi:hypothetical protein